MRLRPGGGPETQHCVGANQSGEKHDFGRQEQPHDGFAQGDGQARLILQRTRVVRRFVMCVNGGSHAVGSTFFNQLKVTQFWARGGFHIDLLQERRHQQQH
jgi:hypothetical protein